MQFKKIDDKKILITLDEADLSNKLFNVGDASRLPSDEEFTSMMDVLLKSAEQKLGIKLSGMPLIIDAFSEKSGMAITISVVSPESLSFESGKMRGIPLIPIKQSLSPSLGYASFSFDDFQILLAAAKTIYPILSSYYTALENEEKADIKPSQRVNSSLYRLPGESYLLTLKYSIKRKDKEYGLLIQKLKNNLCEYSREQPFSSVNERLLKEHKAILIENEAIEKLGSI